MQIGFHIVRFEFPGGAESIAPTLARVGQVAEAVGASHLSVMDHWFQMEMIRPEDPMLDVLRSHCVDLGRDPESVRRTILYSGQTLATGDVDGFLSEMEAYAAIGVEEVHVMPTSDRPDQWIEDIGGKVTSRLAELGS